MKRLNVVLLNVGLLLGGLVTVFPFVWMVLSAFTPSARLRSMPPSFWPTSPTTANFEGAVTGTNFGSAVPGQVLPEATSAFHIASSEASTSA